jgi:hypothetical protein
MRIGPRAMPGLSVVKNGAMVSHGLHVRKAAGLDLRYLGRFGKKWQILSAGESFGGCFGG